MPLTTGRGWIKFHRVNRIDAGKFGMREAATAALAVLTLSWNSCANSPSTTGPGPVTGLKMTIALETPVMASLIDRVTLTLRYDTTTVAPITLHYADGIVHDTVAVNPGEAVTFILRALDAGGRTLYQDRQGPMAISGGTQLLLHFLLRPVVLMLRAGPLIQDVSLATDGLVQVFVDVYNVDSLYGAAFRLHYDPTVLEFSSVQDGDFLTGPGVEIIALSIRDSADFVTYSVARKRKDDNQPRGVHGNGRLATFYFGKKRAGSSAMTLDPATAQLLGRRGNLYPIYPDVVLESATVHVTASGQ